ncbi:hypothetical protein, partial [Spirulina sp. 06S082]|uniref:hypothetical protein n=1 Tax=Spirulina sp. 06S082 TaxID=3110248 RepID=UPI002B1EAB0C
FLQLGRIFRRLGLPLWTFIGIGAAGWWFDNAGVLIETSIKQLLGEESGGFAAYLAPLILFLIPFVVVIAIATWHQGRRQLENLDFLPQLRPSEGKKGIIILVRRKESALHSIRYHFLDKGTLERIWLIPSSDDETEKIGFSSQPEAEKIQELCQELSAQYDRVLNVEIERGVSPADSQDTFDIVNRIFRRYNGYPGNIVADFTGGTKPMSVGMIMACLPGDRDLEYVAYNSSTRQMTGPFVINYQHSAFDLVG